MKSIRHKQENIIKNIRNLFRLEKEKDRIFRDIKNLFEDYYKPVRVNNFWSNNYIEYKTLSVEEYLDKIKSSSLHHN